MFSNELEYVKRSDGNDVILANVFGKNHILVIRPYDGVILG